MYEYHSSFAWWLVYSLLQQECWLFEQRPVFHFTFSFKVWVTSFFHTGCVSVIHLLLLVFLYCMVYCLFEFLYTQLTFTLENAFYKFCHHHLKCGLMETANIFNQKLIFFFSIFSLNDLKKKNLWSWSIRLCVN